MQLVNVSFFQPIVNLTTMAVRVFLSEGFQTMIPQNKLLICMELFFSVKRKFTLKEKKNEE